MGNFKCIIGSSLYNYHACAITTVCNIYMHHTIASVNQKCRIYVRICMHAFSDIHEYIRIYTKYVHTHTHAHTYITCAHVHTYTPMHNHTMHTHTDLRIHPSGHACMHTHTYSVCIHAYVCVRTISKHDLFNIMLLLHI